MAAIIGRDEISHRIIHVNLIERSLRLRSLHNYYTVHIPTRKSDTDELRCISHNTGVLTFVPSSDFRPSRQTYEVVSGENLANGYL